MKTFGYPALRLVTLAGLCAFLAACEFGTNPLILDGSAATAKFPVDVDIPAGLPAGFSVADSFDLDGMYDGSDGVDSVKFYNLTFSFEGDSANLTTRITGSVAVNGVPFLFFDDVPLSAFSPERSIFKPTDGFSYDTSGVSVLREALSPSSHYRTLFMSGDFRTDSRSMHFTLQAKIYTQVFLTRTR